MKYAIIFVWGAVTASFFWASWLGWHIEDKDLFGWCMVGGVLSSLVAIALSIGVWLEDEGVEVK